MSSATTATATSLPGESSGGKYVPPGRRRQLEEAERVRQTGGTPPDVSQGDFQRNDSYRGDSARTRGGFRSDGYGRGDGPPRAVASRWQGLDNDGGYGDRRAPRQSATGTRWDIRNRRRWRPEIESEVFKKDKGKSTGINFGKYDAIPVELSGRGHEEVPPIGSFREARGVHPLLAQNIIRVDYERPTPVQKYSIPCILAGRDLMASAQTGSGKTAAFLFPIITKMLNEGPPPDCVQRSPCKSVAFPVALVLSPTRELAVQIFEESRKFAFNTGIRTVVLYGGSEIKAQFFDLENGCDICVATPGRLSDIVQRGKVSLRQIKYLVLDEADRMLDMGFSPQIYSIVEDSDMPDNKSGGRQTVMFSATFPAAIQRLASEFLNDYLYLTVGRVGSTNSFITQELIYADENSKPKKLLDILEASRGTLVLVFVETKKKADLIEEFLLNCELSAVTIHGDKSQQDRERALELFKTGRRTILVATDVASRGLDINNVAHVINCDLPQRIDDYVHRIGRTGRAGNNGKATSFVNEGNRGVMRELLGLLEETSQIVPDWFHNMVRSCTSAYRGYGSSPSFPAGGRAGGALQKQSSRGAFGSRDVRAGDRGSMMPSKTTYSGRSFPDITRGGAEKGDDNNDEEDGWD